MAKEDHPAYGGRAAVKDPKVEPHILPSVFSEGVYFLHEMRRGKHEVTMVCGEAAAQSMLLAAQERARA